MSYVKNVDLSSVTPWRLEYLHHSESRTVFTDGMGQLVEATDGLVQVYLRFPGGGFFTAHVTQEVFKERFLPLYPQPFRGWESVSRMCPECGRDAARWKVVEIPPPFSPEGAKFALEARCGGCDFRDADSGEVLDADEVRVLQVMES